MYQNQMRRNGRNDRYERHDGSFSRKQLHYSPNLLSSINNAIENNKVVSIEYDSREKGTTVRDAEPMSIIYKHGKRHLVGWCRLREDYRSFRLDRITTIKVNSAFFEPRADFDLALIESQMEQENAFAEDEEDDFEEPEM
jgi:predicted DNA-binding transcriptional regulator YafY